MESKGRNPFDRAASLPEGSKPSKKGRQVLEWERIRAAQKVAAEQRARTEQALARPVVVPPKVVPRPPKPIVAPTPEVPTFDLDIKWNGMNIWRAVCMTMWVILSLAGFSGNFFGGLILSIGLFFVMVFISGMPIFLKGVAMNGGRNNNGKAV